MMKEEDVLKFPAGGTHLGGTNLDFQMEQYICKRKSDGICIINLKRTWEKVLLAARAIVAIENPAGVSLTSSRNTGQRAMVKFADATGATPIAATSFLEPSLTRSRQPSGSHSYLWLLTAGMTTSLSRSYLMLTYLPLLCVTQILLCSMWTLPSHALMRELTQWV
uniref:40S ribosomal protein SA C-terminal domain-containing protein n=1 Tax=Callithrix jacchus TaxID=9483 RepID=A0A8I3WIZ2_CALJA